MLVKQSLLNDFSFYVQIINLLLKSVAKALDILVTRLNILLQNNIFFYTILTFVLIGNIFFISKYDPHFDFNEYDGSNTINIASLPLSEINEVLRKEQNFVFYYYITHFVLQHTTSLSAVSLLNAFYWLLSIYFLYKLLSFYIKEKTWIKWLTLSYSVLPTVLYYARYPRMYMLIILLVILMLYFYNLYLQSPKLKFITLILLAELCLSLLQATSVLIFLVMLITTLFVIQNKIHKNILVLGSLFCIALVFSQMLLKDNFVDIYFYRGVNYLNYASHDFFNFPYILLLASFGESYGWFLYLLTVLFGAHYFSKGLHLKKEHLPIVLFNAGFFLMHILLRQFSNARHFIFLQIPFLIFIFSGLCAMAKEQRRIYATVFGSFVLLFSIIVNTRLLSYYSSTAKLCASLRQVASGVFVTDFSNYNFVSQCKNDDFNGITVLLFEDTISHSALFSKKELLLRQAEVTGNFNVLLSGESIKAFNHENNLPDFAVPDVLGYIENVLAKDISVERKVYLVDTLRKKPTIFTYEIQLMRGMLYEGLLYDTVPVFSF